MSELLKYVKPNGTKVQINAESVSAAESLGWKPEKKEADKAPAGGKKEADKQ